MSTRVYAVSYGLPYAPRPGRVRVMRARSHVLLLAIAACGPSAERAGPLAAQDGGPVQSGLDGAAEPPVPVPVPEASVAAAPPDAADAGSAFPLVDPGRWARVAEGDDPFGDRPAQVECPLVATMYTTLGSEPVFDVDTGQCNYLSVVQPTLREVPEGARLRVRLFHFDLSAPMPAEAHAAVSLAGLGLLDERVPIPASGGLIARETRAERAIPAGTPIYFHLHNHGQNSWALVEVSVTP